MIDKFTFGKITINNKDYDDIKIIGENIIPWQYIEHHTVTEQDIIEITEDKPEYAIIGIGTSGLVHVKEESISLLKEKHIKTEILLTKKACNRYNELKKDGKKVDAIIHSTC